MEEIIKKQYIEGILNRYKALCTSINQSGSPVTLVAVSKTHSVEIIEPLLQTGHREFGENRVQEAYTKWPALKQRYPDICLHLIGSLQSNKVKEALALFDVIETLDRPSLVDAIAKERARSPKGCSRFLIQVNTGEEPQKSGVAPKDCAALYNYAKEKNIPVYGLMCVPPANDVPAPHFAFLHKMAASLNLPVLSMGMSGDYATAIRLGATHVRIGTALFGERENF